jgi:hypothetical protein
LEAPLLHLERARDCEGGSKTAWCADYWWGECPGRGSRWRESKNLECMKIAKKNRQFPALADLKIIKNEVFYLRVLNKIYSRDIF